VTADQDTGAASLGRQVSSSWRDRVQHFHAWLYPRPASSPLRGTQFLSAPQHSDPAQAEDAARAIRRHFACPKQ
jgi:hypothetical protein